MVQPPTQGPQPGVLALPSHPEQTLAHHTPASASTRREGLGGESTVSSLARAHLPSSGDVIKLSKPHKGWDWEHRSPHLPQFGLLAFGAMT